MINSCCNPYSNPYKTLQWTTASAGAFLTAATLVTAYVTAVYAVTTLALPVILGAGALLAWIAFLSLTINRCASPPSPSTEHSSQNPKVDHFAPHGGKMDEEGEENLNEYYESCKRTKVSFIETIEKMELDESDYKMIAQAAEKRLDSVREFMCEVEDPTLLQAIQKSFAKELAKLNSIASELKNGKHKPNVQSFKAFDGLYHLLNELQSDEVKDEHLIRFEELLTQLGDINKSMSTFGDNPLLLLAKLGQPIEFVELLAKRGANFNYLDNLWGNTPLIWAVANGHNTMALEIIQKGEQNLDIRDNSTGNTPLLLVIGKGYTTRTRDGMALNVSNLQLVKALLDRGADPNVKDSSGLSPLQLAIIRRDVGMIEALRNAGALFDFDWRPLLELSYQEASEKLKSQAAVYILDHKSFEECKAQVISLLPH